MPSNSPSKEPSAMPSPRSPSKEPSLFDDRALKDIGGFETFSLLPQAISIARLRRRQTSWKFLHKANECWITTVEKNPPLRLENNAKGNECDSVTF